MLGAAIACQDCPFQCIATLAWRATGLVAVFTAGPMAHQRICVQAVDVSQMAPRWASETSRASAVSAPDLVDLSSAYSKRSDLADALVRAVHELQQAEARTAEPAFSVRSVPTSGRRRMRPSAADTEQLIATFTGGASKRELAERYGISESGVKRLIRQHEASKPSSGLSRG